MAKKKKKRRPRSAGSPEVSPPTPKGESKTSEVRREKKEAGRRERERAAKARARRSAGRRALIGGLVGLVVFFAISWFNKASSPTDLAAPAASAASAAACQGPEQPLSGAPGGQHLGAGQDYTYEQHPATSGFHDPAPLQGTPRVYTLAVPETQAVHSLEHGSVIMYYRPSADPGGLSPATVAALGPVAEANPASYLIPYADLPEGTALAFTAWNTLMTCPASITTDQAKITAQGFIDAYVCTSNAPEGRNGDGC